MEKAGIKRAYAGGPEWIQEASGICQNEGLYAPVA